MRLLYISEYFPTSQKLDYKGGVEARLAQVVSRLSYSHQISVVTSNVENNEKMTLYGAVIYRCGPKIKYNLSPNIFERLMFVISAINTARKVDADIIEGTDYVTHFVTWVVGMVKRKPVIAWYPDVFIGNWVKNMGLLSGIFGALLERFNLSLNWDGIIAISNSTKSKLIKEGVKERKITVVACGVNLDYLSKYPKIYPRNFSLVCVSRLVKYKQVEKLIETLKNYDGELGDYILTLIGSGPQLKSIKKLIKVLRMQKKIKILGFVNNHKDVLKVMRKSSLLVHPSSVEGFGIVLVEAMAQNTPYVAFKIPAIVEVTNNGMGGILIEPFDFDDFGKAIIKFKNNKGFYLSKSKEASEIVKKYDWQKITNQTLSYYQKIYDENRRRI